MLPNMPETEPAARQRKRKNYIDRWMRYRDLKPGDVIEATGAGKELVWKWRTKDNFPTEEYLAKLLALLRTERECLFSPPPGKEGEGKDGPFVGYAKEAEAGETAFSPAVPEGVIPREMIFEVLLRMEGVDRGKAELALAALIGKPIRALPKSGLPDADDQSSSAIPRRGSSASSLPATSRRARQRQTD